MVVNKRRKVKRMRGSRRHGWGRMHRGSGQRGGAGNAGSGKRADAKKPSCADRGVGKHGFKAKGPVAAVKEITLQTLDERLSQFADKGAKSDVTSVDLTKLGYTKLLGTGRIGSKVKITIAAASRGAIEKVKAAGGEVLVQ